MSDDEVPDPNVAQNAIHVARQFSGQLLDGLRGAMSEGDAMVTHSLALAWAGHMAVEAMRNTLEGDNLAVFESVLADVRAHAEVTAALRLEQLKHAQAARAVPVG